MPAVEDVLRIEFVCGMTARKIRETIYL